MLDEQILQERLKNFNPEPLIDYDEDKAKHPIEIMMVTEDENTVDLAKANFLNVWENQEIRKDCENIIRKYGVGTCGPRAFYGTTDIHLELEERIAKFLGLEASIVYSYGFVAISSSIAAYCKKSDICFVDKHHNFAINQGLVAARSRLIYFDHNDPKSLEHEAGKIRQEEKNKKKIARKFLIIEGVSWKTGKVCPLPEFLDVAEEYKLRVFLEESYSIGIFGKTGKGLTEHFNIGPNRVDMIISTFENAIGSIGGFCAGTQAIIEHQTLSGSGYIFSASLPTYLVQAVIKSIDLIEEKPAKLQTVSKEFQDFLIECNFEVSSDPLVPFKIFTVKETDEEGRKLKERKIHDYCKENGVYFIHNENGLLINLKLSLYDDKVRLGLVHDVLRRASRLV